ncbi:DUF1266 domain-containing protein [Lipingzhangella sp. LS1_29]|uniref:DUF1266 domain-containing protein n=1 Tax=Lipingzhangella rawalii TaxID=2055835 RepID=A0ABU2H206_9ACTN|nr:DUF1266 domain-containing protein [Lipingzhangella rawalii]MDS1269335.1 DUF1266 domain-containing protein [Lipingzhangella rawalii]
MLSTTVSILGALTILAWLVIAWASNRRQPWALAPLALLVLGLLALGHPGWALLPLAALVVGSFTELVIGVREPPALRTRHPEAPLSTERWAAAVAAPFRVALAEPWDVVVRPSLRRRYRRVLTEQWGAVDRDSLLTAVDHLWSELRSGPRADLIVDLSNGVASTRRHPDDPPGRTIVLTADQVARLREISGAHDTETVVIGAFQWWTSAHLIRLACGGAALDWLTPRETNRLLRQVASDLQRRYGGWYELAQAFHAGHLLWDGAGSTDAESRRVWTALGILTRDPDSPWNQLPWDMPLERVPGEPGAADSARL